MHWLRALSVMLEWQENYIKDLIMVITWPGYKLLIRYIKTTRFCTSSLLCTLGLKLFKFRINKRRTHREDKFEGWLTYKMRMFIIFWYNKKCKIIYILFMYFIWGFDFVWCNTLTFYSVHITPLSNHNILIKTMM